PAGRLKRLKEGLKNPRAGAGEPATGALVIANGKSDVISRDNPATCTFLSRTRLNRPGSKKVTWHIEIDLAGSGIDYMVGDSFGIFPANDPALVSEVISMLGVAPEFPIA